MSKWIILFLQDKKSIPTPFMADNNPKDQYLYEITVETGVIKKSFDETNYYGFSL